MIARDYARTDQSDAAGGNRGMVVGTDDVCHTHIEDLLATTWSLVCEIRTPTQACQDRPHQEGHRGRWIPAVLAHHRAVAAMLALSVEGFFGDFSLIPTGFRRNPLSYRRLAMILASISGGQSLGKPLPDLSRQGQSLCEGPFSVSCRKSKPFKPSDAVGFDEKSRTSWCRNKITRSRWRMPLELRFPTLTERESDRRALPKQRGNGLRNKQGQRVVYRQIDQCKQQSSRTLLCGAWFLIK